MVTTTSDLTRTTSRRPASACSQPPTAAARLFSRCADVQGSRLRHRGRRLVRHICAAGTPRTTVNAISKMLAETVQRPEVKERLLGFGLQPTGTDPDTFAAIQKRDSAAWEPAVKGSGYTPEQ